MCAKGKILKGGSGAVLAFLISIALGGCQNNLNGSFLSTANQQSSGGSNNSGGSNDGGSTSGGNTGDSNLNLDSPALFKLTPAELIARIKAIVYGMNLSTPNGAPDYYSDSLWAYLQDTGGIFQRIPSERTGDYDRVSSSPGIGQVTTEVLFNLSNLIGDKMAADSEWRWRFVGDCAKWTPETSPDSCVQNFATRLFRIVLSKDPDSNFVDACVNFRRQFPTYWIQATINYLFLSMSMTSSYEFGDSSSSQAGWFSLKSEELAKKFARVFWQDVPDSTLVQLSKSYYDRGKKESDYDLILNYVFTHSKFTPALENFFYYWLKLNEVRSLALFNMRWRFEYLNPPGADSQVSNYSQLAVQEALDFARETVFAESNFNAFFLSENSYKQGTLAAVAGVPSWTPGQAPQRNPAGQSAGLLTLAAHHLNQGYSKTQFHLAYFVYSQFTGRHTAAVTSVDLSQSQLQIPPTDHPVSSVTRAKAMVASADCQSCHKDFDDYGFPLNTFDQWGRFRNQQEDVWKDDFYMIGNVDPEATHTIDNLLPDQGVTVTGPRQLAQQLLASKRPQMAFSKYYFQWIFGREATDSEADQEAVQAVYQKLLNSGVSIRSAMKEIARTQIFRKRYIKGAP